MEDFDNKYVRGLEFEISRYQMFTEMLMLFLSGEKVAPEENYLKAADAIEVLEEIEDLKRPENFKETDLDTYLRDYREFFETMKFPSRD